MGAPRTRVTITAMMCISAGFAACPPHMHTCVEVHPALFAHACRCACLLDAPDYSWLALCSPPGICYPFTVSITPRVLLCSPAVCNSLLRSSSHAANQSLALLVQAWAAPAGTSTAASRPHPSATRCTTLWHAQPKETQVVWWLGMGQRQLGGCGSVSGGHGGSATVSPDVQGPRVDVSGGQSAALLTLSLTVFAPLHELVGCLTPEQRARWDRLWMLSDRRAR